MIMIISICSIIMLIITVIVFTKGLTSLFPYSKMVITAKKIRFLGLDYTIQMTTSSSVEARDIGTYAWDSIKPIAPNNILGIRVKDITHMEGEKYYTILLVRTSSTTYTITAKIKKSDWEALFGFRMKVLLYAQN